MAQAGGHMCTYVRAKTRSISRRVEGRARAWPDDRANPRQTSDERGRATGPGSGGRWRAKCLRSQTKSRTPLRRRGSRKRIEPGVITERESEGSGRRQRLADDRNRCGGRPKPYPRRCPRGSRRPARARYRRRFRRSGRVASRLRQNIVEALTRPGGPEFVYARRPTCSRQLPAIARLVRTSIGVTIATGAGACGVLTGAPADKITPCWHEDGRAPSADVRGADTTRSTRCSTAPASTVRLGVELFERSE